jgi:hypothetical protein
MSGLYGSNAFLIESANQLRDGLPGLPTGRLCCFSVGLAIRDGQDDLAAGNVARWLAVGTADLLQNVSFFVR